MPTPIPPKVRSKSAFMKPHVLIQASFLGWGCMISTALVPKALGGLLSGRKARRSGLDSKPQGACGGGRAGAWLASHSALTPETPPGARGAYEAAMKLFLGALYFGSHSSGP